jgi:hypothetical protein
MDKSVRVVDNNGFFEVKSNPLSLVGVFPYSGRMIGAENPDQLYNVYRPTEELSDDECVNSFKLLPFVDEHHMIGDGAMAAEKKGVHGVIGEDVYFEDGTLFGNIKVFSESLANLIESGKKELSCGYRCEYEFASGAFNGVKYDAIQRNIRGNHLALVEEGRMGSTVAVLDSMVFTFDTKEIFQMEENEVKKVEDAEAVTLESLAAQVAEIMSFVQKLKPLEEAEHGAIDEEIKTEDAEEVEAKDEAPKAEGMDAASVKREVIKEIAQRDSLYSKLSGVVGTFDHSEMGLNEVAVYGVKKLGIECAKGSEVATISGYLAGVSKAPTVAAMDSKKVLSEVDTYLNGGK